MRWSNKVTIHWRPGSATAEAFCGGTYITEACCGVVWSQNRHQIFNWVGDGGSVTWDGTRGWLTALAFFGVAGAAIHLQISVGRRIISWLKQWCFHATDTSRDAGRGTGACCWHTPVAPSDSHLSTNRSDGTSRASDVRFMGRWFESRSRSKFGQVVNTLIPPSPSSKIWR